MKQLCFYVLVSFLYGCSIYSYAPGVSYIPCHPKKGEISSLVSAGLGGVNANAGYAFSSNVGVILSGHSNLEPKSQSQTDSSYDRQSRKMIEISGYWLFGNDEENSRAGFIFGGGTGRYKTRDKSAVLNSDYYDGSVYVNSLMRYNHFFVAPFINFKTTSGRVDFTFGSRFSMIYFSTYRVSYGLSYNGNDDEFNYSVPGLIALSVEPMFKFTLGNDIVRFFVQSTVPFSFKNYGSLDQETIVKDKVAPLAQAGVVFRIQTAKK